MRSRTYNLAGAALILPCLASGCSQPAGQAQTTEFATRPLVEVDVALVERGEVVPQVTLVGAVKAARQSVLGSAVEGRVAEVSVDIGDAVGFVNVEEGQIGQPIAQLLTDTITIEIAAAEAELELRQHELAELEAGTRIEELAQAEAAWEAAEAAEKYATDHFQRIEDLNTQARTISQQEFDEARTAALAARHRTRSAKAAHDLAVAGPRGEQKDQARSRLASQASNVERLKELLEQHTIRAPFKGFVVAKHTEVGAWLSKGSAVAEVMELDPIDVEVQVPESLVSEMSLGDRIPLVVDALRPGSRQLEGRVDRIVPSADLRARTFPVRIRLKNPPTPDGYLLKAGMLARVIVSGRPMNGLLVPQTALVKDGSSVMVVNESPQGLQAREVNVRLGMVRGELIEVRGSLSPGDRVITRGVNQVVNGRAVRVRQTMTGQE